MRGVCVGGGGNTDTGTGTDTDTDKHTHTQTHTAASTGVSWAAQQVRGVVTRMETA